MRRLGEDARCPNPGRYSAPRDAYPLGSSLREAERSWCEEHRMEHHTVLLGSDGRLYDAGEEPKE